MTKKEINEIKSLFDTIQDCGILTLAGCYVDGEKKKVKTFNEMFYNIPEEEMYKYLEIFRKTLSGTPGKNLVDASFVSKDDGSKDLGKESGKGLLKLLRDTELKDEALLDSFYDKVIENYNYVGNYLILLIYQAYDVPGTTSDGIEMDDASEEVFKYILCSICPMKLTKPGLGFDDTVGEIHTLKQIFAVELPENGFLFPEFNERSADDNAVLYSSRRTDYMQDALLSNVLDVTMTLPAKQQKDGFTELVTDVLGEESNFETILSIQENLRETIRDKKNEAAGETVFLDKNTMRNVFEKSGVSDERLNRFDKKYDEQFDMKKIRDRQIDSEIVDETMEVSGTGRREAAPMVKIDEKLFADNVAPVRNIEVRNSNMVLRVNTKHTDIIDTRVIDGRKCLVIELTDDMTVNGIPVAEGTVSK